MPRTRPKPEDVLLTFFDAEAKDNIPTWWNQTVLREAGKPEVSADGTTYTFAIPVDTSVWSSACAAGNSASAYEVPVVRAFTPDVWKKMDMEIEWGFDKSDGRAGIQRTHRGVRRDRGPREPLADDAGTALKGSGQWRSAAIVRRPARREAEPLYQGRSRYRKVWPYNGEPEDVARTIVPSGQSPETSLPGVGSGERADPRPGVRLLRACGQYFNAGVAICGTTRRRRSKWRSKADSAKEFIEELAAKNLTTIRQRTRRHPEQTWEGAVGAMFPGKTLPAIPKPEFEPPMKVDVPCEKLTAQWKLGAWHILRRSVKDPKGKWHFNDYPYGVLACETYAILYALDLQGMHKEAADGLDQWLSLPMQTRIEPGAGGHSAQALPDRPLGLFSDGKGCLTNAEGVPGVGGHMDGIHPMGPGTIMFALSEHFRLTGDLGWLKAHVARIKANAEWILRQRRLLADNIPAGQRLWSKGLQPPNCITTDSGGLFMQNYETEAYYWLAVKRMAELLAPIDPEEAAKMAVEADAYRKELTAAVERSIALSPWCWCADGTYRSFIPFACHVRGLASGAWSWRRPGGGATSAVRTGTRPARLPTC